MAFSSAVAGNTVTVRGHTYTIVASGATGSQVDVGETDTAMGDNFAAVINRDSSWLGVTASNAAGTVTLTAVAYGTIGNAYTLAKVGAPITVGGATFAGGVDFVGLRLSDVGSISVKAEAVTSGQTITGGSLACYVLNGRTNRWLRYADGDLAPGTAVQGHAWAVSVLSPLDYIAWIPSGVTISSGNLAIYLDAAEPEGRMTAGKAL